jgi:hypothetical protein
MESKDSESKENESKDGEFKTMDAKDEAKGSAPQFMSSTERKQVHQRGRRLSLVGADGKDIKRRQSTLAMR